LEVITDFIAKSIFILFKLVPFSSDYDICLHVSNTLWQSPV